MDQEAQVQQDVQEVRAARDPPAGTDELELLETEVVQEQVVLMVDQEEPEQLDVQDALELLEAQVAQVPLETLAHQAEQELLDAQVYT